MGIEYRADHLSEFEMWMNIPPDYLTHPLTMKANDALKAAKLRFEDPDYRPSNSDIRSFLKSVDLGPDWQTLSQDEKACNIFQDAMDIVLSYILDELWERSSPDKIPDELMMVPPGGRSLVVETAECMLLNSLESLLERGVPAGKDFTPAAVIQAIDDPNSLRPFTRGKWRIRNLLDGYVMCAEPAEQYFSVISFKEKALWKTRDMCIWVRSIMYELNMRRTLTSYLHLCR